MSKSIRNRAIVLTTVAVIALSGAGFAFHEFSGASAQPTPPTVNPAVPVGVRTVHQDDVTIWSEFSGRLNAVDYAEIRPEVSGRITEVRFRDGQNVRAGAVLFVIDPRPYEAALAKAQANVATARTNADFAKTELDRATTLVEAQAIAQRFYDERANQKRVADAAVLSAQAELKQAELNLDYAYVKAPISGRLSHVEITLGNLVQAGSNAPVLTSIVSNDGIYADFDVDEQTYMSIRAQSGTADKQRRIPVELMVQGDTERSYKGTIYSFDNKLNSASGTIRARARFDNKDDSLVPGMFVSVRLGGNARHNVVLVPERAIGNDQNKKFIFVVGDANKATYREVSLGAQVNRQRIVLSGLQPGERVIVDGLQHIRPDVTVQPNEDTSAAIANGGPQSTAVQ